MKTSRGAIAALGAGLLVLVLYGRTLGYGLAWDDYAALRPRATSALLGAWTGSWDPGGVWPDFFRPMSIAVYDAMFRVFGHNGVALHAVNLAELWLAAMMLYAFVRLETASHWLGVCAALLLVLHPQTPTSLAAWISQQFHLVALICVLASLLTWQRVRHRGDAAWAWVLVPLTFGVLMKEDVLMLAPTLVAWHVIRARIVGDVAMPSRRIVITAGAWMAIYCGWRTLALGAIGGYDKPDVTQALLNAVSGPVRAFAFLRIPGAAIGGIVAGAGAAILAVAAWRQRRKARPPLIALAWSGIALAVLANIPLLLITGPTRMYLLILAATLTLTAVLAIVCEGFRAAGRAMPRAVAIGLVAWSLAMTAANWANTSTFAPCAVEARARDDEVLGWHVITGADRQEITTRRAACAAIPERR